MTFKQANDFIAKWRPILCSEWEIEVREGADPGLAKDDHRAAITPASDYLRAVLYTGVVTEDDDDRDAKRTLLHELFHLTVRDLELAAKEAANGLGHDGHRLANETIDRYVERTVDRLACALVDFA